MRQLLPPGRAILRLLPVFLLLSPISFAADHNDPNAINSIFSDIDANAADLYDVYGFTGRERSFPRLIYTCVTEHR